LWGCGFFFSFFFLGRGRIDTQEGLLDSGADGRISRPHLKRPPHGNPDFLLQEPLSQGDICKIAPVRPGFGLEVHPWAIAPRVFLSPSFVPPLKRCVVDRTPDSMFDILRLSNGSDRPSTPGDISKVARLPLLPRKKREHPLGRAPSLIRYINPADVESFPADRPLPLPFSSFASLERAAAPRPCPSRQSMESESGNPNYIFFFFLTSLTHRTFNFCFLFPPVILPLHAPQ